jgi:tRNA uridine 5-carbamoylmethylation protein Kti12
MLKLILMCGNIGCGKSILSKKIATENKDILIVDHDKIIEMLHSDYTKFDMRYYQIYKDIEKSAIESCLRNNMSVIVDKLNHTKIKRKRYIEIANSINPFINIEVYNFSILSPDLSAKNRFLSDNKGHSLSKWLDVANKIYEEYEEPESSEGIDEIYNVESYVYKG